MIRILISIAIMAVVTYVPYAVLSALTFPGIFYATGNMAASFVGTVVALAMAYFDLGLLLVAIGAVIGALIMLLCL